MSNNDSSSRPKRTVPSKKEGNCDLLKQIKRARDSGTKHREEYKEENIYDIVDEKTYADVREKRRQENIVEDESDDGREIFESSDEEVIVSDKKRKKITRNCNIKRHKSELKGKPNVHEMLLKSQATKSTSVVTENFDDLLEELTKTPSYGTAATKKIKNKNEKPKIKNQALKADTKSLSKKTIAPVTKKDSPVKTTAAPVKQFTIPEVDIFQDESMGSWNDEVTATVSSVKIDVAESMIDEFDDMDFDEPFDTNKGFCEPESKSVAATVMWDQDEQGTTSKDECDIELFEEFQDKSQTQVYWIDAYHDPKIPGSVFLFGKTLDDSSKSFVNCCIKISGLERRLFFLPKSDSNAGEVYKELVTIFDEHKVSQFRCKNVNKRYAFQLAEVPDEADYMMVLYDAKSPALPADLTGETFSHVFGCETSILELLILDLKLKGPCWLNFTNLNPISKKFSICKLDFEIHGIKNVSKCVNKLPSPPLTLLSINIKTIVNSKTSINEIVSIGAFVHNQVSFDQPPPKKVFQTHFTILTPPKDSVMPYDFNQKLTSEWGSRYKDSVTVVPNERALISNLMAQIHKLDPDLIVGHSLFGHQLQILLQRCQTLNISMWYRLGRLNRNISLPRITGRSTAWLERMATAGRLICDTEFSGRELVKCRSYELSEMVKDILPKNLHGLQNLSALGDLSHCFLNSTALKQLIDVTMDEAISNIYLMHELQILPLAFQITAICGNLIARTLSAGKSERNEYLLLHAFNEKNYVTPDKYVKPKEIKGVNAADDVENEGVEGTGKRKPTYLGGLVLEPKKGFYENFILLMDFNSLYPSIIQELNICFTTIDRQAYLNGPASDETESADDAASKIKKLMDLAINSSIKPPGILPTEIRKLVESRKQVKSLLLEPNLSQERKMQYDIRQKALKITANSMYGCLGFSHSRFQATQLASLITCKGRDILQRTKEMVESGSISFKVNNVSQKLNLEIVYGDTDSIMVNTGLSKITDYDTVMSFGKRIKEEVNKVYKNIQIDIDGVFRRLLLLKKKKYAALTITKNPKTGKIETKQELKGLDIVRRDWCKLAIEVGHNVVTQILEGELSQEDLVLAVSDHLVSIRDKVNSGSIVLDQFVITKGLARNPETYVNPQGQPHVQVALRHNKSGATRKFKAQDTVEYVICDDGSSLNPVQRAYSPREVLDSKSTLKIDSVYYLSHQLHPVISRLVDGIEGLSPASVAESLGLDPKGYVKHTAKEDTYEEEDRAMSGGDRFKNCKGFSLKCLKCQCVNELASPIAVRTASSRSLWPCTNCKVDLITPSSINRVLNTLTSTIKMYKRHYYSSVYTCQEPLCDGYTCREVPVVCRPGNTHIFTENGQWICPRCGKGAMKAYLDHHELYNQMMFMKSLFPDKRREELLDCARAHIDLFLKRSAYRNIDFGKFATFFKPKNV